MGNKNPLCPNEQEEQNEMKKMYLLFKKSLKVINMAPWLIMYMALHNAVVTPVH